MPSSSDATDPVPGVSVVIPVYQGSQSLIPLVTRLQPVLRNAAREYEIILVNDGSPDQSWRIIDQLSSEDWHVRGIDLARNYGQHNALLCGIRAAAFDITVTMDDDLQHPPEEIPRLLLALRNGADVVYGRPEAAQHGFWRNLASECTKIALKGAMGASTARHVSAFRAFRTPLRDAFSSYHSAWVSLDALLTWGGTRFEAVAVRHDARNAGLSNYTAGKLLVHALNMMTGFSTIPLRLASLVGFCFTGFGVLVFGYVVGRFLLFGGAVPGFSFLASTIAIFSGVQLFALGIIGEYLARIHLRLLDRPSYVIRARTEAA